MPPPHDGPSKRFSHPPRQIRSQTTGQQQSVALATVQLLGNGDPWRVRAIKAGILNTVNPGRPLLFRRRS